MSPPYSAARRDQPVPFISARVNFPLPLPAGGRPVAEPVRRKMEAFFGADFSDVRIHVGPEPEALGALAFTRGSDLYFAPGHYEPLSARGQELLAHELTHVLQQRAGLVDDIAEEGPSLRFEAVLEEEAYRLGALAARWTPGAPCAGAQAGILERGSTGSMRPRGEGTVLQPWIRMAIGTGDDPTRYGKQGYAPKLQLAGYFNAPETNRGKPLEEKFELLTHYGTARGNVALALEFLFGLESPPPGLEAILMRWMGVVPLERRSSVPSGKLSGDVLAPTGSDSAQMKDREDHAIQAEMKYFLTYGELAWALMQELALEAEDGSDSLAMEQAIAKKVLEDKALYQTLNELSWKLVEKADEALKNGARYPASAPVYGPLHGEVSYAALMLGLKTGKAKNVAAQISRLHDVKDLFKYWKLSPGDEPAFELHLIGVELPKHSTPKKLRIEKYDMRYNLGTPDEADDWVLFMRERKRAVWAGPSYTMYHMWNMARSVGATMPEKTALGYAMFAFWCLCYAHTATPVHRFHETLAAAHEFGVPYFPLSTVEQNHAKAQEHWKVPLLLRSKL